MAARLERLGRPTVAIKVLEFATVCLVQDERQLEMMVYFVLIRVARMLLVSNDKELDVFYVVAPVEPCCCDWHFPPLTKTPQ